VTKFSGPVARVQAGQTAHIPVLIGSLQEEGSISAANLTDISVFIASLGNTTPTPAELREAYPNRSDSQVIADVQRDIIIKWCVRGCSVPILLVLTCCRPVPRGSGPMRSARVACRMSSATAMVCALVLYLSLN
jgi:hypothetical protein